MLLNVPVCLISTHTALEIRLVCFSEKVCQSPDQFKAWSQNIGHTKIMKTFNSYGEVDNRRQGEIILGLRTTQGGNDSDTEKLADALAKKLRHLGI